MTKSPPLSCRVSPSEGQRNPSAQHGCGAKGEQRPPRYAAWNGGYRRSSLDRFSSLQSGEPRLAGSGSISTLKWSRLHAALCAFTFDRLRSSDEKNYKTFVSYIHAHLAIQNMGIPQGLKRRPDRSARESVMGLVWRWQRRYWRPGSIAMGMRLSIITPGSCSVTVA